MSRGFHAFFRQYYNLRALLRRTDPTLPRLTPIDDYPLVSAEGHRDSFARIPRTPPLNLATFVLRSKTFTLRRPAPHRHRAPPASCSTSSSRAPSPTHDGESAAQFLDRLRFPAAARHLALEVFARSFFADPTEFSAGELIAMFHSYFLGSAEGLLFDVPDDDYDTALWAPLARLPAPGRGVDVRTGTAVPSADRPDDDGVDVDDRRRAAARRRRRRRHRPRAPPSGCVAAPTARCAADADVARAGRARCGRRRRSRSGGCGSTGRRARDRPAFLGTAGFGCVDNISVLERFEAGAAAWARRTAGSVVELHAYALPPDVVARRGPARRCARARAALPRARRRADVVAEEYLVEADCPLVGTEPWADRPGRGTPDPRVVLAGDGVRCDYPTALMERAATTGFQAANRAARRLAARRPRPVDGAAAAPAPGWRGTPARAGAALSRQLAGAHPVAPLGVGQVVHPQVPRRVPHGRAQQRRQPRRDPEAAALASTRSSPR